MNRIFLAVVHCASGALLDFRAYPNDDEGELQSARAFHLRVAVFRPTASPAGGFRVVRRVAESADAFLSAMEESP